MYQPSPYAYPIGSFQVPIAPPTVPPTEGPFLYIPLNCDWFPPVAGALMQLLLQTTWDCDAETLVKVQGWIFDLISRINCSSAPTLEQLCGSNGSGGDDCMGCCQRFVDGILQTLECGVWTDVPGQTGGNQSAPNQPGAGSPQPAMGQCVEYTGLLQGNGIYLIPTLLSSGDSVQIEKAEGATNDSLAWFCPDGDQFGAGQCFDGLTTFVGTDPLPSAPHLSMLLKVGTDYYPIGTMGTVVVGGGHTSDQALLIMNTSTPSTVNGSIQFKISVCNNQVPSGTWTHIFDFLAGPQGFAPEPQSGWTPDVWGQWTAGVGWGGTASVNSPANVNAVLIGRTLGAAVTINTMEATYNLFKGTFLTGVFDVVSCDLSGSGGTGTSVAAETAADGTGETLAITPGTYSVNHFLVDLKDAFYATGADGTVRLTQLVITGQGADPF